MKRLEVRCMCGALGRLIGTDEYLDEKQVCKFLCHCESPKVNFDKPYR